MLTTESRDSTRQPSPARVIPWSPRRKPARPAAKHESNIRADRFPAGRRRRPVAPLGLSDFRRAVATKSAAEHGKQQFDSARCLAGRFASGSVSRATSKADAAFPDRRSLHERRDAMSGDRRLGRRVGTSHAEAFRNAPQSGRACQSRGKPTVLRHHRHRSRLEVSHALPSTAPTGREACRAAVDLLLSECSINKALRGVARLNVATAGAHLRVNFAANVIGRELYVVGHLQYDYTGGWIDAAS